MNCDLCKAPTSEEFGCECDPLAKRVKFLMESLDAVKQHAVAEQNFKLAERIRDSRDQLILGLYVLRCQDD